MRIPNHTLLHDVETVKRNFSFNSFQLVVFFYRVHENPGISTHLCAETGLNNTLIWKTLRKEQLNYYHFTPIQKLLPQDPAGRLQILILNRQSILLVLLNYQIGPI